MDRCDVLIVGGGPAGSTLAWALRGRGLDVAVLDRARFPRDKVCAGWITPVVVRHLRIDLEDYRDGRVLQPIEGFRVGVLGGEQVSTPPADGPLSYGILRREFDHYLLQRSGARLLLGRGLSRLERRGAGWEINGAIRARVLVGAGGHFCPVARMLESRRAAARPVVCAQEVEFEMTPLQAAACTVGPRVPELFFCRDLKGYGWVFRKGDHLNIGMGREDPRNLPSHLARFQRFLFEHGKAPPGIPRGFRGHAYRLYTRGRGEVTAEGVLLVGDAAALAYPESGEGIRPAVESGLLAAEAISTARGDYRRSRLAPYEQALIRRFGERDAGRRLAYRLPPRLKTMLASRLLRQGWFVRRVVLDRWFLHKEIPADLEADAVRKSETTA